MLNNYKFATYMVVISLGSMAAIVAVGAFVDGEILGSKEFLAAILVCFYTTVQLVKNSVIEWAKFEIDLVRDFNHRYDKMNAALTALNESLKSRPDTALSAEEISLFARYVNLCAEEWLQYSRGYISKEVWDSWTNGMQEYWRNDVLRAQWKSELSSFSHYRFKPEDHFNVEIETDPSLSGRVDAA